MRKLISMVLLAVLVTSAMAQQKYTGKGVNMVIIDTGFDLLHPAFTDEQGNTRIKELFLYMNKDGEQVTVDDEEKGHYTLNGSVFNTTEASSSRYVISVGNYDATYKSSETGFINSSSSFGTMLDGTIAPTICAPGQDVLSCANGQVDGFFSKDYSWDGHPYTVLSGTSMASPYVAGVIATWLEANPKLTVSDVQTILQETALKDEYTEMAGAQAGYGKLDKQKAWERVLNTTGIHSLGTAETAKDDGWYTLSGVRLSAKPVAKGVYVHGKRTIVIR